MSVDIEIKYKLNIHAKTLIAMLFAEAILFLTFLFNAYKYGVGNDLPYIAVACLFASIIVILVIAAAVDRRIFPYLDLQKTLIAMIPPFCLLAICLGSLFIYMQASIYISILAFCINIVVGMFIVLLFYVKCKKIEEPAIQEWVLSISKDYDLALYDKYASRQKFDKWSINISFVVIISLAKIFFTNTILTIIISVLYMLFCIFATYGLFKLNYKTLKKK